MKSGQFEEASADVSNDPTSGFDWKKKNEWWATQRDPYRSNGVIFLYQQPPNKVKISDMVTDGIGNQTFGPAVLMPCFGNVIAHYRFCNFTHEDVRKGKMIVGVHTGLAPAIFGEWGKLGLDFDTAQGRGRFMRMANTQRHQATEMTITSMLFGGTFERHPKLTLLIAELGI